MTDAGVTGILIAHLGAFGSGELKIIWFRTTHYIPNYPGIQFRLPCTPPGQFFMGAKLFIGTPWMGNEGVLKKILVLAM